jgi:exopolysaccharide production protein ExoQ
MSNDAGVSLILISSKFDGFILFFALILANLRALIFIFLFPDTSVLLGPAWIEIACWLLVVLIAAYDLKQNNQIADTLQLWRRNWLLALFLLLAFVSVSWSVGVVVTLFRVLELLFSTLIASYVGLRFRPAKVMEFLFWFGALVFIFSIALVFGAPKTGTMYWAPFDGAWRGIYWHRNHLASIAALLNMIYLSRMLIGIQTRNSKGVLDAVFYIISLMVLYFSKSATGYILFIVLHFFIFCAWLWLRISNHLQRRHYFLIAGLLLVGGVLVLSNLDIVFGLFNRDATLTGRISLWSHLLDLASRRLWLGHGFGTVWAFDSFREEIRQLVGWASQPLIADNGFLDILLHLGVIGLLLFVGVLVVAAFRSFRYALEHRTLADFLPLLVMIYVFFANISFSLFAETEVFVWFLIVVVLFMTTPSSGKLLT